MYTMVKLNKMEKSLRTSYEWNYYVMEVATSQLRALPPRETPYPPPLTVEPLETPYQDLHSLLPPPPLPSLLPRPRTARSDNRQELNNRETLVQRLPRQNHKTKQKPQYFCNTSRLPCINALPKVNSSQFINRTLTQ